MRTQSQTGMVDTNWCNSKLLLLRFVCLSSCCKPATSRGATPQLSPKRPGGSSVHSLSPKTTLARSTHQKPGYEVVKNKIKRLSEAFLTGFGNANHVGDISQSTNLSWIPSSNCNQKHCHNQSILSSKNHLLPYYLPSPWDHRI